MRSLISCFGLLVMAGLAAAQNAPPLEARLVDGSILRFQAGTETLSIVTKFGKLQVPLNDVQVLELAFRYPPGMEARVQAAENDLASPDFRTRERAGKVLLELGALAVPAVKRAMISPTPEVATRAASLWVMLEKQLPKSALEPRNTDRLETADAVIIGQIESTAISVKTAVFDKQTLHLHSLREIRRPKPTVDRDSRSSTR
jgi:hypothetical protein